MKSIVMLMLLITVIFAKGSDFIIKRSHYTVNETLERFKKVAEENGFTVFSVIDHQSNAKRAGLKMHEQKVVIFGNPVGGTRLMNSNPRIGIELPLKVAIYKDKGIVQLIYKNPAYYESEFSLRKHPVIENLKKVLNKMSNEAIN